MVENDIEDHIDSGAVRVINRCTKVGLPSVDFEEVVTPVSVVVNSRALPQDRTYPQGCHSKPLQVADL